MHGRSIKLSGRIPAITPGMASKSSSAGKTAVGTWAASALLSSCLAPMQLPPQSAAAVELQRIESPLTRGSSGTGTAQLLAARFICDEKFKKCVEAVSDNNDIKAPEIERSAKQQAERDAAEAARAAAIKEARDAKEAKAEGRAAEMEAANLAAKEKYAAKLAAREEARARAVAKQQEAAKESKRDLMPSNTGNIFTKIYESMASS
mmetsp:Transcript_43232/g.71903  ORF Transcript_43232/g.71903 Transcript_43232/m.71903 type:complete len:206 (+) Transcript_43232:23-640(+)